MMEICRDPKVLMHSQMWARVLVMVITDLKPKSSICFSFILMAKVVGRRQRSDNLCLQLISYQTMNSHMEKTIHYPEILDGTQMCLSGRRGVYSPCGKKGEMGIAPKTPGGWTAAETAS